MRILIDGDACPQKEEIAKIAREYDVSVIVYMDYAHISCCKDYIIKYCMVGKDSVDMLIVKDVQENDIVITQDYGLASLVLAKNALVLHVSGMMIDKNNIEELLLRRYVGYKERKQNKHLKGPRKRTKQDEAYFIAQLRSLLEKRK